MIATAQSAHPLPPVEPAGKTESTARLVRASRLQHQRKPRMVGGLVRLKNEGYGFIRPDSGPPDYYVSISSLRDPAIWKENQRVSFLPGDPHPDDGSGKRKATPAWDVAEAPELVTPANKKKY